MADNNSHNNNSNNNADRQDSARELCESIKDSTSNELLRMLYDDLTFDNDNFYHNDRVFRYDDEVSFKAVTTVEEACGKFFVPVWASVYGFNSDDRVRMREGYVLYPDHRVLEPLEQVFHDLTWNSPDVLNILALSAMPVALALETLHQPTKRRFHTIYHRDLDINSVYLPFVSTGGVKHYGEAKVKLAIYSGPSRHDHNIRPRNRAGPDNSWHQWYHHPDLRNPKTFWQYHKKYDWYSFGLYLLDLIHRVVNNNTLREPGSFSWLTVSDKRIPAEVGKFIRKELNLENVTDETTRKCIRHYIEICRQCISIAEYDEELVYSFEDFYSFSPDEPQLSCVERGISRISAELLELYQQAKELNDCKVYDQQQEYCQACLKCPAERLPFRTFWRKPSEEPPDIKDKQDELKTFCKSCYFNGNMLFNFERRCVANSVIGTICDRFRNGEVDLIFNELAKAHDWSEKLGATDVWIEKVDGICNFNRMAAPYYRNEYSSFIVPVWGAAFDIVEDIGYILYPDSGLLTLSTAIESCESTEKSRLLLKCALSVAFALDGLHQPTYKRRAYCYNDVLIENVYVCKVDGGEFAKLKISERTCIAQDIRTQDLASLWKCDMQSFGRFIRDLIQLAYGKQQREEDTVIKTLEEVADSCLTGQNTDFQEIRAVLDAGRVFEHPVRSTTWKLYKKFLDYQGEKVLIGYNRNGGNICQACFFRSADGIPFKIGTLREETDQHMCDNTCAPSYCHSCYNNGERLFCPIHLCLRQPLLGPNCYAMIFYGLDYPPDVFMFEKEAYLLYNCLMHNRIRNLPKDNIVISQLVSEDAFKEACKEMRQKINKESLVPIVYSLTVAFIGHGKPKSAKNSTSTAPDGSWFFSPDGGHLSYETIDEEIFKIRDGQRVCNSVVWIMDHCTPCLDKPQVVTTSKNGSVPISIMVTGPSEHSTMSSTIHSDYGCIMTQLLCSLFRGDCKCPHAATRPCHLSKLPAGSRVTNALCVDDYKTCWSKNKSLYERHLHTVNWEVYPDPAGNRAKLALCYSNEKKVSYAAQHRDCKKHGEIPFESKVINCAEAREKLKSECLLTQGLSEHSIHSIVCDWNIRHLLCNKLTGTFDVSSSKSALIYGTPTDRIQVKLIMNERSPPGKTDISLHLPSLRAQQSDNDSTSEEGANTRERGDHNEEGEGARATGGNTQTVVGHYKGIPTYPNIMEFVVHEIRHIAQEPQLPEGQPEIFKSLLETLLGENLMDIQDISIDLWQTLMHCASDTDNVKKFNISREIFVLRERAKIVRIEWGDAVAILPPFELPTIT